MTNCNAWPIFSALSARNLVGSSCNTAVFDHFDYFLVFVEVISQAVNVRENHDMQSFFQHQNDPIGCGFC